MSDPSTTKPAVTPTPEAAAGPSQEEDIETVRSKELHRTQAALLDLRHEVRCFLLIDLTARQHQQVTISLWLQGVTHLALFLQAERRLMQSVGMADQSHSHPVGKSPHPLADGITARLQQHLHRSKLGNGPATPVMTTAGLPQLPEQGNTDFRSRTYCWICNCDHRHADSSAIRIQIACFSTFVSMLIDIMQIALNAQTHWFWCTFPGGYQALGKMQESLRKLQAFTATPKWGRGGNARTPADSGLAESGQMPNALDQVRQRLDSSFDRAAVTATEGVAPDPSSSSPAIGDVSSPRQRLESLYRDIEKRRSAEKLASASSRLDAAGTVGDGIHDAHQMHTVDSNSWEQGRLSKSQHQQQHVRCSVGPAVDAQCVP